jgi:hypothetical protein
MIYRNELNPSNVVQKKRDLKSKILERKNQKRESKSIPI